MDKFLRRLIGISLEFNRINTYKRDVSISEYLVYKGVPFCHYATYQKMLEGEYANDDLYLYMLKMKEMNFDYHEEDHYLLRDKYFEIKKDIEFIDRTSLIQHLKEANQLMVGLEDNYPHKIECFILKQIERYYINEEILDDKTIKILSWIVRIASSKSRAILIHLIYFNTHKKRTITSSLRSTFESLPLFDKDEMLIALVIIRQMIYEKEFNVALSRAKKIEKVCLQSNNYARLTEVYQDLIAIYGELNEDEKSDYYVCQLKSLINVNPLLDEKEIYKSKYYLAMCDYTLHKYDEVLEFLLTSVKQYPQSYSLNLFYQSVVSYLNIESAIKAEDISLENLDVTNKVFLRYYIYKLKGKSNRELTAYIMNKIMPILNHDYAVEANIFRQELYLMGAKSEFEILSEKMKSLNYVILQNWEKALENK